MLRVETNNFKGMQTFLWVWIGQVVSLLGSSMTRFALVIWAYQQTGSATTLALLGTFNFIPYLLLSPFAGVMVDRWDRRKVMLLTDIGAGLATILVLVLFAAGRLAIWHIYLLEAISGGLEAFQVPAYHAASSVLVPKALYGRTSGMRALGSNISRVFAPSVAGALMPVVTLSGILLIDIVTFLFACGVLLFVFIPRPEVSAEGQASQGHLSKELWVGIKYILRHQGLTGLMLVLLGMNILASLTYYSILSPMILSRTGGNEWALGIVQSMLGIGGIAGAFIMSTLGGNRKYIHGVLLGGVLSFLLGDFLFAVGRSLPVWIIAALVSTFFIPFISAGSQAIWQLKVPHDLQGRVFSSKDTVQQLSNPFGYLAGGLLADHVFEPALMPGGFLEATLGCLVGTGPGAGMGAMFLFTCVSGLLISLAGYLSPALRHVED